ncbi:hypothetical protein Bp8pS_190 [Bacillus phage vB_BpuM-BpSp]|nr:hypothetical protein Bp8pS_190 [Bacillus phage vB_BpuM-BpSp]
MKVNINYRELIIKDFFHEIDEKFITNPDIRLHPKAIEFFKEYFIIRYENEIKAGNGHEDRISMSYEVYERNIRALGIFINEIYLLMHEKNNENYRFKKSINFLIQNLRHFVKSGKTHYYRNEE